MSRLWYFLLAAGLAVALGCQPAEEPAEEPEVDLAAEEDAISDVIDNLVAAMEQGDLELWASTMARDPEMVNIGVSVEDYFVGWEALKEAVEAEFASTTDTEVTLSDLRINVMPDGKHAWATCLWDWQATIGEQALQLSGRWTGILEKREEGWVFIHNHDSVGLAAEEEAEPEEGEEG